MRHAGQREGSMQGRTTTAEGRGGRRRRPLVLALAVALALVGSGEAFGTGVATAAPVGAGVAQAKAGRTGGASKAKKLPAGPTVRAIPGRTTASLTWAAKKGAKRYLVELTPVATKATPRPKTRKVTTSRTTIRVTGLRQQTAYRVRVTVDRGKRTRPSKTLTVRTSSAAPARVTARIKPAGTDAVRVSWPRPKRATSVSVTIAPTAGELGVPGASMTISGISAWTTSKVVKIPARMRTRIGSTSGNPVHARVTVYNSALRWTRSATVSGYAGSPKVRGTTADRTRVATYNVQLPSVSQSIRGRSWAARREAVARAIAKGKPDVVGLQEVGMGVVSPGVRQYQDLAQLIAPYGYAWATTTEQINEVRAKPVAQRSFGAHLAYRTATTELLDSGFVNLEEAALAYDPTSLWVDSEGEQDIDRFATWALFRDRDSQRVFYAASVHLKVGETMADLLSRDDCAGGLDLFLRRLASSQGRASAPIVILGDLNSDNVRHPEGAQETFVAEGYVSSASAPKRSNMSKASVNSQALGYPSRPAVWTLGGPRIDYIFARGGGGFVSHLNQVVLTRTGTFDERYRGSDHNLQLAVLSLAPR